MTDNKDITPLVAAFVAKMKSGGATPEQIQQAVDAYLEENPVQPGATVEQVAQIEKNKTDISELSEDIDDISKKSNNILDFSKAKYGKEMSATGEISDNEKGILFENIISFKKGETKKVLINKPFNWKGNYAIIRQPDGTLSNYLQFNENSDGYLEVNINDSNMPPQDYRTVSLSIIKSSTFSNPETELMCTVNSVMPESFEPFGRYVHKKNFSYDLQIEFEGILNDISEILTKIENNDTWYKGKKVVAFGDSITAMALWFNYVKNYFGFSEIVNRGIGGTTVHNNGQQLVYNGGLKNAWMCSDERIDWLPNDADVVLVMGGMNDWSVEMEIGEITTGNDVPSDATFIGAYQIMLSKLIKKYPNAKLFTMTVTNGRIWSYPNNKDVPPVNWGKTIRDFADATIKVSNIYGIPCIDLNGECGFSFVNSSTYTSDGTHPNDEGAKLMSNQIINGLIRYMPIDF